MSEYHKIQSLYKRDPSGKTMLFGEYSLDEFRYLRDCTWDFTEKVDGTNIRIIVAGGEVTFGGKTDNAQIPTKLLTRLQERFFSTDGKARLLEKFPEGGVLYGEGHGAGIQKGGGNYRKDQDFVLFDVRVREWWLQRSDVENVAQFLGIEVVPLIMSGTLGQMEELVKNALPSRYGVFEAEGIVARPHVELKTRAGHRIITKLKVKDFS